MGNNSILIIGLVWPEPQSSAAGRRMMQLIFMFKKLGYEVHFASTALENQYNFDLAAIGIQKTKIELNASSFDTFVKNCNPTVVLFDRFVTEEQFGWRVSAHCPAALKMLDSEDLHCLRHTRGVNLKRGKSFEIADLFEQDATKREIASILRCDLTLIIAEYEMVLLSQHFKIDTQYLFYLPLLFEESELNREVKLNDFQSRKDFVFIGNFWHEPNWDAVLYLKKTIWPLIRKQLPQAIIRIYGAYPSQKVFDLNNKNEGFLVLGRADDAKTVVSSARILLAPLRFGAGLKGKLLEAMQFGTPSITSSIGAESINGALQWSGFITDDATEFALKTLLLYTDEKLWLSCQNNGKIILQQRFKSADFEIPFYERIQNVLRNLERHRQNNFYGAMLLHHSLKSSEYMARWIEEKNKSTSRTNL